MKLKLKIILQPALLSQGSSGRPSRTGRFKLRVLQPGQPTGKKPLSSRLSLHELDLDPADPERFHCQFAWSFDGTHWIIPPFVPSIFLF